MQSSRGATTATAVSSFGMSKSSAKGFCPNLYGSAGISPEFVSELRYHRFQRIGRFEFGHENFARGRPWLLKRMVPSKTLDDEFRAKLKAKRDKAKAKKARAKVVRLLENLQI